MHGPLGVLEGAQRSSLTAVPNTVSTMSNLMSKKPEIRTDRCLPIGACSNGARAPVLAQ